MHQYNLVKFRYKKYIHLYKEYIHFIIYFTVF